MTATLARTFAVDRPSRVPVALRPGDRWRTDAPPTYRRPVMLLAVLAGSLAVHAVVVAMLVMTGRPPLPPVPHEIAVEIVQEAPKPPPKAAPTQTAAAAAPKPLPAVPPPAKLEPVTPSPPKPPPPAPKPAAADPSELVALQKELAALKAEHVALEHGTAGEAQASGAALPKAFQAVALPRADGDGESVGYQEIVFSQLAKAKGLGRKQGVPGTAGVRFAIDDSGALVSADIATPSGIAALDAEALDIVHKAAPFPPPPKGAQREFYANVNFVPQATP